jgi:hypothetical protein
VFHDEDEDVVPATDAVESGETKHPSGASSSAVVEEQ